MFENQQLMASIASSDRLSVRKFKVGERICDHFVVTVEVVSENPVIDFDAVIGQEAQFALRDAVHERIWAGICSFIGLLRDEPGGLSRYQVEIVPYFWLATKVRRCRVFQQQTAPDILHKLLKLWGIDPVIRLGGVYKKRPYCVQYAESDFAFFRRICEWAGISFFWELVDGKMQLVLADAPQTAEPRAPRIPYRDDMTTFVGEFATKAQIGRAVRPGSVALRDHDIRLPASYALLASAEAEEGIEIERQLETYDYAPGQFLVESAAGDGNTPVADDRIRARSDETEAAKLARKRLSAQRSDAYVISFETNAHDLAPGMVASIYGHSYAQLEKGLLIVETQIEGTHDGRWTHTCKARRADKPYAPPVVTPKPKVQGIESATVVGPRGDEIHTDEFSRVRLHFHWNRESRMDEHSSCWVEVAQGAAGSGFGMMNIPRIGQEVFVDFLGGDPDQPVVVGRRFTRSQAVPEALPANKTQSAWRSRSTPGGGGYNEILFEDAAGREQFKLRAERDFDGDIGHDAELKVGQNITILVQENTQFMTGLNRTSSIGVNDVSTIGGNQVTRVAGGKREEIGAAFALKAGEKAVIQAGPATVVVEASGKVTIKAKQIAIEGSDEVSIAGAKIKLEASGAIEIAGGSVAIHGETVDAN